MSVPWRIVQRGGLAFADSDDRQLFGLAEPIDGAATAHALLKGRRIAAVEVDRLTADLHVHFDRETRIDLFNHSAGYEGWAASYSSEDESISIIALAGGDPGSPFRNS